MTSNKTPLLSPRDADEEAGFEGLDIDDIISMCVRHLRLFVFFIIAGVLCAVLYTSTAVRLYTAETSLFLDVSKSPLINRYLGSESAEETDGDLLSELEVMRSKSVSEAVVDKLKLADNEEFMAVRQSLIGLAFDKVSTLFGWRAKPAPEDVSDAQLRRQIAVNKVQDGASISRVALSYIFDLRFVSTSPKLSAQIAEALSEAYVDDRVNSTYDIMTRTGDWLRGRVDDLREATNEAGRAVQKYRTDHGLIKTKNGLLSDQRLEELNTALTDAHVATGRAQARYDNLKSVIDSDKPDVAINDPVVNMVANQLQAKYVDVSRRAAQIAAQYGENHIQAIRLRQDMADYRQQIFQELKRAAEAAKSDLDVAQAHENSLASSVAAATADTSAADESNVELRELERREAAYRNMYQGLLDKYQQSTQEESFPVTNARVISQAQIPDRPSFPRFQFILFLFVVISIALAFVTAIYLESRRKHFESEKQLNSELGLDFLGASPLLDQKADHIETYALSHPFSSLAEMLRSTKLAVDVHLDQKPLKVIGVVSAASGEGSSFIASNFAALLASQGNRPLLIDGDLRSKGLTRLLAPDAREGIVEVLLGSRTTSEVLVTSQGRFRFLPAGPPREVAHSSQLLGSPSLLRHLSDLTGVFDYVIIDLPPLGRVVDARAVSGAVDAFVLVVDQPRTNRDTVRNALIQSRVVAEKCIGVIFNKVDPKKYEMARQNESLSDEHEFALAGE